MTRLYFEKEGFNNFHKAFVFKTDLKRKQNIYCKIIETTEGFKLTVTSVKEQSQNLLKELGFKEIGRETF